jgi:hypothetical protein
VTRNPRLKPVPSSVEQAAGDTHVVNEPIPAVCFIDDVARILRTSRRTIDKLRRHRCFHIPELPAIDKRPRWSGEAVKRFLDGQRPVSRGWKRSA